MTVLLIAAGGEIVLAGSIARVYIAWRNRGIRRTGE